MPHSVDRATPEHDPMMATAARVNVSVEARVVPVLRAMTPADRPQLNALVAASVAEGFAFLARWRDALDGPASAVDSARQYFLGAFENATLVAVGGVTPDPYDPQIDVGRIRHVYVAPLARRRGVGRQLLAALEGRAGLVYGTLRLRTDTPRAAAFYEALGYERTSEKDATHRRVVASTHPARD